MRYIKAISGENTESLAHYGVLGMKWGVRRYQDYGHGGYNPKHEGQYKGPKDTLKKVSKLAVKSSTSGLVQNRANRQNQIHLDTQEVINRQNQTHLQMQNLVNQQHMLTMMNPSFMSDEFNSTAVRNRTAMPPKLLAKTATRNAMQIASNQAKHSMNCVACTMALDYRLRGHENVLPRGTKEILDEHLDTWESIKKVYNLPSDRKLARSSVDPKDTCKSRSGGLSKFEQDALTEIALQGNGARGQFLVSFLQVNPFAINRGYTRHLGGHSIMYQVEKNKVYIYDAQVGRRMEAKQYLTEQLGNGKGLAAYRVLDEYFRTDDKTLNEEMMHKYLQKV